MPGSTRSSTPEPALWAVVLAGGIGSRFWPVSTPDRPKQLLPLAGDEPLIRQTLDRIGPLVPADRTLIVTAERIGPAILAALPGLPDASLLCEPRSRGTAPALGWAATRIHAHDPRAVMISLHADHVIEPAGTFRDTLRAAAAAAVEHRRLFTIGAVPTRPETGYGYILPGPPLSGAARAVERFVEKPDRPTAEQYVRDGCLWNTGIFVWPVSLFLEELRRHTPELSPLLPALDAGDVDGFFARAPSLSVDHGLLERSDRVAVMPASFRWDDVGAWDAVARTRPADARGNVLVGSAHAVDSERSTLWSEDGAIVAFGVHDVIVVRTREVTLVVARELASDLKKLLDRLPAELLAKTSKDGV